MCIWGFGFDEANKAWPASVCLDVVNWFKGQGCYVIGGVPTHWRRGVEDSRAGYLDVCHAFDMLSPWMVGRISDIAGADVQGIYISMFDEYNEGNQIAKTAESAAWVPAGSGIRALDEDGTACSADYYLRLTNDGGRMFKGQAPLTSVRPTVPMPVQGPGGVVFLEHVDYGGAAGLRTRTTS
ncbi:hypothetical protein AB0H36_02440 [Kribbella sp. NPDC050820]|uniref:hypothetical protein n=1 Tax=Kribbella sp. NPDC050820 TaxID=3155408 RepID=UPI0033D70BB8